jgi:hypothetical protein
MGVRELKAAFNEVSAPTATCTKALMETLAGGIQKLYFSGSYADGEGFAIQSEQIRPNADLIIASRDVATALLNRKRAT